MFQMACHTPGVCWQLHHFICLSVCCVGSRGSQPWHRGPVCVVRHECEPAKKPSQKNGNVDGWKFYNGIEGAEKEYSWHWALVVECRCILPPEGKVHHRLWADQNKEEAMFWPLDSPWVGGLVYFFGLPVYIHVCIIMWECKHINETCDCRETSFMSKNVLLIHYATT